MHWYVKYCVVSLVVTCILHVSHRQRIYNQFCDQIVLWMKHSFTGEDEMLIKESRNQIGK